ncbi:TCR/Tet family MFS transporter [Deminuibacter soli]|uniref:MFS transporter n=1 Tax=Deminuibacter soli TaxID=2291815 RepID=A0A3E1NJN6_9BACT|nr:TCR/Tet family MFS transporter [Deminuibacter soli]RFM28034.1 MFS transporter [Deminuibacter soli]
MRTKKEAALGFIFITILIDVTGLGIIIPILPELLEHMIKGDLSKAAVYNGWLTFAYAVMQFSCAPILGNLSDRFGRRPVLLLSLLGFGIDYLFQGFAPTIGWLFVGRILAGVTGASFTTATAYIADISTPEKRAQNFGLVGAAFGLGFIIGPSIGSFLGHLGLRVPFFVAAGLSLCNCLYGYFVLPESLSRENRRPFSWKRANPIGSFFVLARYPAIRSMVVSLVLIYIAGHALQSTWTYYGMLKFGWDKIWVGISLSFVGLMVALVQGGLIRVIIPAIGQHRGVYVGLLLYATGMLLFAFATKGWMMFAFIVIYALGGIAGPSIQGLITGKIPPNEQGELQGTLTSLVSLTAIVGPLMMTNLFSFFTTPNAPIQLPGAPFLAGAALALISALLAYRSFKKHEV